MIRSDGKVGGYNRGANKKRDLLIEEGSLRENESLIKGVC
ncbi:MAG: MGMT family protein [Patescibacteria group bacterium]